MSLASLIEKFRSVALDRIEKINITLVSLEREPDNDEASEEVLREIHTLKGEAKMMGFADVNLVAHQTEHLLIKAAGLGFRVDRDHIDLIFEGLDIIRMLLTKRTGSSQEVIDLAGFVDRVSQRTAEATPQLKEPSEVRFDHDKPSTAVGKPAQPADDEDAAARRRTASGALEALPSERGTRARIQAADGDDGRSDAMRETPATGLLRIQTGGSIRVNYDKLERIGEVSGDVLLTSRRIDFRFGDLEDLRETLSLWISRAQGSLPRTQLETMRDIAHQLDGVIDVLRDDAYQLNLRSGQLDDEVRRMRHVSLAEMLSHYPRAVRDLARSQGKRIRLVHEFGSIEVDRTVLGALSDPLLHLVRNAVDHGIESPEERRAAGKDEEGEIRLIAEHAGNSLQVVLADDGRGIDLEHVKARAISTGLVSSREAETISDQDVLSLIFEPGFSTREVVSDVSGRGLGMDIVLRQITGLGGLIEVESEVDRGTTFTIFLPLPSAVTTVLIVRLAGRQFGLIAKEVERVEHVPREDLANIHDQVCYQRNGELLFVQDWRPALGLGSGGLKQGIDPVSVLVIRQGSRRAAVLVDEVIGEREAINRPLGEFLDGLRLCRGVALTEAGEAVPMLNVIELTTRGGIEEPARVSLGEEDSEPRRRFSTLELRQHLQMTKTILVVEDSEVTRSLITGVLRGMGYKVIEAVDGREGFDVFTQKRVDMVLTDIQMPHMNGLELLEAIRSHDRNQDLPVVVLSTLGEKEDKERAMRAGADAYLVKLNFEEKQLIQTVHRFLGKK